jgi:hypothetical protein
MGPGTTAKLFPVVDIPPEKTVMEVAEVAAQIPADVLSAPFAKDADEGRMVPVESLITAGPLYETMEFPHALRAETASANEAPAVCGLGMEVMDKDAAYSVTLKALVLELFPPDDAVM